MNRNLLLCAALACAATLSAQTSLADVNKDNYTNYPDGNFVYQFNNEVNPKGAKLAGTVWNNIFPTPKQVTLAKGFTTLPKQVKLERKTTVDVYAAQDYLESKLLNSNIAAVSEAKFAISLDVNRDAAPSNEGYTLTVGKEGIEIVGCSPDGVMNGVKTLVAAIEIGGMKLPNVAISDYPDFSYRGLMLDISRNYTSFDDIKRTIDLMAAYKLNVFHFHFADDEAWCLEIPGLPELTEVGAVRENTYDEKNAGGMATVY
ncbi:MAG: family 20 glycosylhydrolase, partial [Muribaculaceae bacterium]